MSRPVTDALGRIHSEGPAASSRVDDPDADLVRRVGAGDALAVRALTARKLPRLTALAARVLGDAAEAEDVAQDLSLFLKQSDPEAPWFNARIFQSRIRRNIKLAEAPSFGQSIFDYASKCPGAQDYGMLAEEVEGLAVSRQLPLSKAG